MLPVTYSTHLASQQPQPVKVCWALEHHKVVAAVIGRQVQYASGIVLDH